MNKLHFFDPEWYLKSYPDVAAAGIDPREHFEKHGRREGRLPCNLSSIALERKLWANAFNPDIYLKKLKNEAAIDSLSGVYALKALLEFFLFSGKYSSALAASDKLNQQVHLAKQLFDIEELCLLRFESLFKSNETVEAKNLLNCASWKESPSKLLAREMLSYNENKLESINRLYSSNKLSTLKIVESHSLLDSLSGKDSKLGLKGMFASLFLNKKVSIIVPVFNAEKTIQTSLKSLFDQTWKNIEIVVVNDSSTDLTAEKLQKLASEVPQLKITTNAKNLGAYASRNKGAEVASGDFITVMDADDWAHPQKIEYQILPLLFNKTLQATVSHWVRCSNNLHFSKVRAGKSWVHRNVSSLMMRKSALKILEGWDNVRVNADTEFYERLLAKYGRRSILEVLPDVPLSFGRVHESSLTQNLETHLVYQYGGVRKSYMDFARAWHLNVGDFVNPGRSVARPFPVPPVMYIQDNPKVNEQNFLRWQKALDEKWYTTIYEDVDKVGASLHEHFWRVGEKEGRYPSPLFDPLAYSYKFNLDDSVSPTWHALNNSWRFDEAIKFSGSSQVKSLTRQKVALFGHAVSSTIFGAERSLLDIATALFNSGVEITLFLPSMNNKFYIEELRSVVKTIVFIPLPWAKGDREPLLPIVKYLERQYTEGRYDYIYTNTLTLVEPLIAADRMKIPSITHVRELVEHDHDLAKTLDESPNKTRQRLLQSANYFIANSKETAQWLSCPERTAIVYNCITGFEQSETVLGIKPLKICMISSNVKKKGVNDFFMVANRCKDNPNFQFTLYGPITHEVISAQKIYGGKNVNIAGYIDNPKSAIESHSVVLSLSSFKESFGRTVAEAMTLGRVVVGYNWGAVSELLDEGSGYLVKYQDIDAVVSILEFLLKNPQCLCRVGSAASKRAMTLFSEDVFKHNLVNSIDSMIQGKRFL